MKEFLERNGIDVEWYEKERSSAIPRYIRVVARPERSGAVEEEGVEEGDGENEKEERGEKAAKAAKEKSASWETAAADLEEMRKRFVRVAWLRRSEFLTLPGDFELNRTSEAFKQGLVSGMDAASGFACEFLDPQPGDRILDIACAPGGKLMLIADLMKRRGLLIGVDVSRERLYTCRSLLRKHGTDIPIQDSSEGSWYVSLVHDDGTRFDYPASMLEDEGERILFDSLEESQFRLKLHYGSRLSKKQKAEVREKRELQFQSAKDGMLFNKILVDAECTHDGSMKHLEKPLFKGKSDDGSSSLSFVSRDMESLTLLQLNLLRNGFRMLEPGGTLVYSTCSFCSCQNEGVVQRFLSQEPRAKILIKADDAALPSTRSRLLEGAHLFTPSLAATSGLFVVALTKENAHTSS